MSAEGRKRLVAALAILLAIAAVALSLVIKPGPTREILVITGSTTVLPVVEECARECMKLNPNADIRVSGGGTGVGIANLIDGICDIAMASREPGPEEIARANETGVNLVLHRIAIDAICVIVHPVVEETLGEPLELKLEDLREIFTGERRYWNQVDPRLPPEPIIVFVREPGSGTRGTFEELILREGDECIGYEKHGNPALRDAVAATKWSIGYVGLGFVNEGVRVVWIYNEELGEYAEPSKESARSGIYPLTRYLYLVTDGVPPEGSLARDFIEFVLSPEGQRIVEEVGYISITERAED